MQDVSEVDWILFEETVAPYKAVIERIGFGISRSSGACIFGIALRVCCTFCVHVRYDNQCNITMHSLPLL